MNQTHLLQEIRIMRFTETYERWKRRDLTQEEAGDILGVNVRTFRRYIHRYEEKGLGVCRTFPKDMRRYEA
ncbi:MAG: hypothetical protein COX57_11010 [Alphaproteobacteria bacterium CG_4_10_14_0_2_um_filter_63_37]|nr:MAG: hypothetical protein AUJ55_10515 [Proteobacteria bacterium CG1_02_64_396]PJA23938.1 MAG: hypothetical protein COX57_11010 [Alphaproteobacteria bacterium CG_4_10_14_0_2_um_filter_63_37]